MTRQFCSQKSLKGKLFNTYERMITAKIKSHKKSCTIHLFKLSLFKDSKEKKRKKKTYIIESNVYL